MNKKKIKESVVHDLPKNEWEKAYRRYNLVYDLVFVCGIVIVYVAWQYFGTFYGVTALAFGLWNWYWYEDGASENCIDEYEYAYPEDGFRRVVKSLPWFAIPFYFIFLLFY